MKKRNITNMDYDSAIAELRVALANDDVFKDYNFEASGLSALLKVLNIVRSDQAITANMVFNEMFTQTAELRGNVGSDAAMHGYCPYSKHGVAAAVNIVVTPTTGSTPPSSIELTTDAQFIAVIDSETYYFSPVESSTANLVGGKYTFENVTLVQGVWNSKSFTINGTAVKALVIEDTGIDLDHVQFKVYESSSATTFKNFTRFQNAFQLVSQPDVYYVEMNSDEYYQFEAGDGLLSTELEDGNVVVIKYLSTSGSDANGITSLTPMTDIGGFNTISVAIQETTDGTDEESIKSIRFNSSIASTSGATLISNEGYKAEALTFFPGCICRSWSGEDNSPRYPGYQFFAIRLANDSNLSDSQKESFTEHLSDRNAGSITPKYTDPRDLQIDITASVKWSKSTSKYTSSEISTLVKTAISDFGEDNLNNFDTKFELSSLSDVINDVDDSITGNFTTATYKTYFDAVTGSLQSETLDFNHTLEPGSILVSGIYIDGAEDTLYDEDGVIKATSGSASESLGTVDYDTGIIQLDSMEFSEASTATVAASPALGSDQSISAETNVILSFDSITVTPVVV